ncbi:MAG: TonB family protein [Methylococcaceae bacterium]|nr:TonB family protein [Methylococcaceae bacterium]
MNIYPFEGSQPSGGAGKIVVADIPVTWRRPLAVAAASILAAGLHGLVWFWYMSRPKPAPLIEATPLPMIDIALSASPTVPQPVASPPPESPKPPQAAKKPKPKPVKKPKPVRKVSELKRVERPKEEPQREEAQADSPTPAAPPTSVGAVHERVASPPHETYTPASSNAHYLNNPRPVYPDVARSRNWDGLVLLRVHVTEDGHCSELSVQRSSGHEMLDESAMEAVRRWRFVPAKRGELAQASWVTVPIEFRLE